MRRQSEPEIINLGELIEDPDNVRQHNARNIGMIADSLQEVGAARSIVINGDNKILAGNGTVEAAAQVGIENVMVVEVDGNTIVAVKRTNLTPEQEQRLALWDNRANETSTWDADSLLALGDADSPALQGMFTASELDAIAAYCTPDGEEEEPATRRGRRGIRYPLEFRTEEQKERFLKALEYLESAYNGDTVSDRLLAFLEDSLPAETFL